MFPLHGSARSYQPSPKSSTSNLPGIQEKAFRNHVYDVKVQKLRKNCLKWFST